jgi:hypothetical protein
MYGRQSSNPSRRPARETYISEEDEVVDDDNYANSYDEGDFEMVSSNPNRRESARRSGPTMKKIRVKVHADDTRYVMVGTAVEFRDFIDQIRAKFGIRQSFKVKIRDEADMITMADQDDLDMAIDSAKAAAKKEKSDMGKMEVRCLPDSLLLNILNVLIANLLCFDRFGYKLFDLFEPPSSGVAFSHDSSHYETLVLLHPRTLSHYSFLRKISTSWISLTHTSKAYF